MNTFSLSYLRQVLIARQAFIYHGAGFAKGLGTAETNALSYLDRIRNAISHDFELCCSTVRVGDSEENHDFWGRLGVIIWPNSANSVTLVSACDAGTLPDPKVPGRRNINRMPITQSAIVESIDKRPPHTANEWCVLDYKVLGLFVEPPIQYSEGDKCLDLELADIFREFPDQRVFTFWHGQFREILPPNRVGSPIFLNELLPAVDSLQLLLSK